LGGELICRFLQISNYPGKGLDFDLSFLPGSLLIRQFGFEGCKVPDNQVLVSRLDAECCKLFLEDYETKRGRGI
jgi:hypothetical protein